MSCSGIKVSIGSYQRENQVTKYGIEVKCGQQEWKIYKRYSEIEEIHQKLCELFQNMPHFPKKQLFHLNLSEIEFRREELNIYLHSLIPRREIVNSKIFRDFLILDQHDQFLDPVQISHSVLNMSVKELHENENLTLALLYDSSLVCRVDTYVNNILDSSKQAPASALIAFLPNDYKTKLFQKEFKNPASCLNFNNSENAFAVGFSTGALNYYRLDNQNFSIDMEEQFQISQRKISGCAIVQRNIYIISGNLMKIQNTKKIEEISEITVGSHELNCILYNSERSIVVIANCTGEIFICQVPFVKIDLKVKTETPMLRSLLIDNEKNYLMFLNFNPSHVQILDYGKGLQNGFASVKTKIQVRNKSLCFEWSKKRGELFIGNEDGTISIWNASNLALFYVFKAHSKGVNKILWNENKSILLTCSDDESIKQWFLNKKWIVSQADNFSTF